VAADPRLEITKRARWHSVPVASTIETQRTALAGPTRTAIAKAARERVETRPLERIEDFYWLHVTLRKRKYRLLAQPLEFFRNLERRFREVDGWHPLGAYRDGRLLAATVYLKWRDVLYYKFNASAVDELAPRPNNLLVWDGLALARRLGCRRLDLGPSDDDQPGLIRFKHHFGAEERELRFLRYTPRPKEGSEVSLGAARALLVDLTSRMTAPDLPDDVTAQAGTALYRFFA
jgi:lipid II:glycine glycyltransferase (peptidoglycan interpeptide bridge formation enzyme)